MEQGYFTTTGFYLENKQLVSEEGSISMAIIHVA